ncbi:hypothetical protein K4L44_00310 [Halosquirtibacter laminarini]|uniref:Uncharacterized protein n=1 Tax=Halosquirtibacter laminarini TaxID=3374600 RepID=A0AC61NPL0_9BACT|nr:hypothetical protein K4L44_00310 [Prolixibacteraceae bacterium]
MTDESTSLVLHFDCKPERSKELYAIVESQMRMFAENSISDMEFDKATKSMTKKMEEYITHSSYYIRLIQCYLLKGKDLTKKKNRDDHLVT